MICPVLSGMPEISDLLFAGFIIGIVVSSYCKAKFFVPIRKEIERNQLSEDRLNTKKEQVRIIYGSVTGTAKSFAQILANDIALKLGSSFDIILKNASEFDEADLESPGIVLILCATWEGGTPVEPARRLHDWLDEYAHDFRVNRDHLSKISFAVFGLGGKVYGKNFCKPVGIFSIHILSIHLSSFLISLSHPILLFSSFLFLSRLLI